MEPTTSTIPLDSYAQQTTASRLPVESRQHDRASHQWSHFRLVATPSRSRHQVGTREQPRHTSLLGRYVIRFNRTSRHPRKPAFLLTIGLYRENAIAIESEARDPFGGNVYYVTMKITFPISEFARKGRNLHCDVVHVTTKWVSRLVLDHAIAAIQTSR